MRSGKGIRIPIRRTGAFCCVCVAIGQAANPLSPSMNSRRLMAVLRRSIQDIVAVKNGLYSKASRRSLDYLVGQQQEFVRDCQAQFSGRFQIEDELKFCRLLHRQVGWVRPLQDFVHIGGAAP